MDQNYTNNTLQDNNVLDNYIEHVVTCTIISVGLPLTLVAIYAVYSLVRKDQVAPIYVINLLISDLIQLCCMIIYETVDKKTKENQSFNVAVNCIYAFGLMASVGFMVCIALERYLVIAWPLWYRSRRTIQTSVVVCVMVWAYSPVCIMLVYFCTHVDMNIIFGIFFILPFPLLIFFLAGTIKALSAAISVFAEEKRRIVGLLVLVLLIYTLLFLPGIIYFLKEPDLKNLTNDSNLIHVSFTFFKLSPLADLFLYIFLRKGAVNKILACLCCCRKDSICQQSISMNDDNVHTVVSTV